ncbi:MAG TPA: hypothetical protein VFI91_13020 [Longimicrobiaceae bacterium]|nr:hypothetical protein [Longimicrobiaceae bacterium]
MPDPSAAHVRLVFADEGTFHDETIAIELDKLDQYERLIDLIREEPSVTKNVYIDLKRLVSATVISE